MRRFTRFVILAAGVVLSACSTDLTNPDAARKETQVIVAGTTSASCTVAPNLQYLNASIDSLMKVLTPNSSSAQSKWSAVQADLAAGNYTQAQADLDNLISFINLKYGQVDTTGIQIRDPATGQLVNISDFKQKLFLDLQCYVDKNTFDLNPNDPAKVFVDQVTSAGVYFPPGFVPQGYNVEITTPTTPPLNTPLDQYPSFIDIKLKDANGNEPPAGTTFNGTAVVAVCFPAGLPSEVADRLLLGHQASGGFELLPKVSVPQELASALTCGSNLQVAMGPAERVLRKAADWLLPEKAYAAFFAYGGVGGSPEEFSPFGATDPGLLGGGAGGSPEEFAPGVMPSASASGPMTSTVSGGGTNVTGSADEANVTDPAQLPKVRVVTPLGTGVNGVVVTFELLPPITVTPASQAALCGPVIVDPVTGRKTLQATTVSMDLDNSGTFEPSEAGYASVACINFGIKPGYMNLQATFDPSAVSPLACFLDSAGVCATATTSTNFLVATTFGAATKLVVVSSPASAQAGKPFTVSVKLQDQNSNDVTSPDVPVAVTLKTGAGTFVGTTPVNTVSGVATFSDLRIDGATGDRTFEFSSGSLTKATATVNITAGDAAKLKMSREPSASAQAGVAFTTQPAVQVVDAWDNPVAASATVTASLASGADTLKGTLGVTTDGTGLATFTDLRIDGTAGDRTLQFASAPLTGVTSLTTISVGAGNAAKLVMVTQPSSGDSAGVAFATQPSVRLRDTWGNDVTGPQVTVTAAITAGGAPALAGTVTASTVNGVASFTNLRIDGATGTRSLTFTAGALTAAVSNTFTTNNGRPTKVETYLPTIGPVAASSYNYGTQTEGQAVSDAPRVLVRDAWNNPADNVSVTWSPLSAANGAVAVVGSGGTTSGGGLARITSWTLGAGANQLNAEIAASTTPAIFTAATPTGQSLFACAVGGSKVDIGGMTFPKVSGTVREITIYLSVTGQASTEATYNANLVVRKNSATGDSIGGLTNGGITLPGNNGAPRAVTLRLSDPVLTTETAGTGASAVSNLWFNLTFTNLPGTRKIQVWYNNTITKSNQGPCYSSIVYSGTTTTISKRGLGINVTN